MKALCYCLLLFSATLLCNLHATAQSFVSKSIRSFGARGNGKSNDSQAFEKAAAYFNARGGNGKLIIPKGVYIVGKQVFSNGRKGAKAFEGRDLLLFDHVSNLTIEGHKGTVIRYASGLKLGSFNPVDGKPYHHNNPNIPDPAYAGVIGACIMIRNAHDIRIRNLEMDGNNDQIQFGGQYGDIGIQLSHTGILVQNSRRISVDSVQASHFGLDGMMITNIPSPQTDSIFIRNCRFEYNGRQGLSWVGGNHLQATDCDFNFSGKGKFCSPPGAGVDIEAEVGPNSGGRFIRCNFIGNKGCGMVSDVGKNSDCIFTGCTFWGTSTYAVWVKMPAFRFINCNIYGGFVHGYDAQKDEEATTFSNCSFEDKPYKNEPAFGAFLIESDGARRMRFEGCTFTANRAKLGWLSVPGTATSPEKKQMIRCKLIIQHANYATGDFVILLRGVKFGNNSIEFRDILAKEKNYWPAACCTEIEDLGGNRVSYP